VQAECRRREFRLVFTMKDYGYRITRSARLLSLRSASSGGTGKLDLWLPGTCENPSKREKIRDGAQVYEMSRQTKKNKRKTPESNAKKRKQME
jgi:hypothetical protein